MTDMPPTNPESNLCWHLAFTRPAAERVARSHLERQGYGVYLPQLRQKLLQRGKWCDRITALFPRYVFVQLNPVIQSLAPVRSTVGVVGVVRFGVDYAIVPDPIVERLRANEDPDTRLHRHRASEWFKPGAAVRIASGAIAGLEGIFVCEDANERVTVLLNMLGRETQVRVDAGYVVPNAA